MAENAQNRGVYEHDPAEICDGIAKEWVDIFEEWMKKHSVSVV